MSSMAVDRVNVFLPDPSILMCSSAFRKASVILHNHTRWCYFQNETVGAKGCRHGISSHGLDDVAHRVLVGSSVEAVSHVEHVIQVVHFLETWIIDY